MSNEEYRLTTVDNPYNPFTQFESWFLYDVEKGYNTCGLLARVVNSYPQKENGDEVSNEETNRAIDEIIKTDFMNIYRRVKDPSLKDK